VRELKADGSLPANTKLRSSKYLNNLIEQTTAQKQRIGPMIGFAPECGARLLASK
jgi:transposase-like protein